MMKNDLHMLSIVSLLYNIGRFINASIEVIGYLRHPHSSKMHKQPDVLGVKTRETSLTCKILHDNSHHRCISIKQG